MPALQTHLDTSFLIRSLVPGSDQDRALRRWLGDGVRFAMATVAWTEFLCGPLDPGEVQIARRFVDRVPFDEPDSALAAEMFNESGRRRGSLLDCMIAACAVRWGAPLATANPDDFARLVPMGLRLAS
jgi:predicted nucleic acid-binding protein